MNPAGLFGDMMYAAQQGLGMAGKAGKYGAGSAARTATPRFAFHQKMVNQRAWRQGVTQGVDQDRLRRGGTALGIGLLGAGMVSGMMGGPGVSDVGLAAGGLAGYRYAAGRYGAGTSAAMGALGVAAIGVGQYADKNNVSGLLAGGSFATVGIGALMGAKRGGRFGGGLRRAAGDVFGGRTRSAMPIIGDAARLTGGVGKGVLGGAMGMMGGGAGAGMGAIAAPFRALTGIGRAMGAKGAMSGFGLGAAGLGTAIVGSNLLKTGNVFGSAAPMIEGRRGPRSAFRGSQYGYPY